MPESSTKEGGRTPVVNEPLSGAIRFGGFVIDLRRGALLADGTERPLRPKSFALLRYLAERAGQLVGRNEIMEAVWRGT